MLNDKLEKLHFKTVVPLCCVVLCHECEEPPDGAHSQARSSHSQLLDRDPGHTAAGPYGKQESVSLKFSYLQRARITLCCFS